MERKNQNQDDILYQLAIALLELLDQPVELELGQAGTRAGLILNGILFRAFDQPNQTTAPSLTIAIGAQSITIRTSSIKRIAIRRSANHKNRPQNIHALLSDGFALHIKPQPNRNTTQQPQ
jgi:hypothetical protein